LAWSNKTTKYDLAFKLPYSNTHYNLSIWARSRAANQSDERFWSQPAMLIVKTSADRMRFFMFSFLGISCVIREEIFIYFSSCASIVGPCSGPDASLGSFEVSTNWDMRSATIRWSQLPADCENGPETGYEITMLDSQRNTMYVLVFFLSEEPNETFWLLFI
jgi:hypothetical protein